MQGRGVPRPPRLQAPGYYHVTGRGTGPCTIFHDGADCATFLAIVSTLIDRRPWRCEAFCLMGTHYHLLVETEDESLAAGMQWLNGCYGASFNRRHVRSGHLFQGRYHSSPIGDDAHLLTTIRYIALNPVKAGLCDRPEEWRWGSYRAAVGVVPAPRFMARSRILELFSDEPARAVRG